MEKAILAYLRHRAFWKATIGSQDPEVRKIQRELSKDYLTQKAVAKAVAADVN